MLKIRNFSKNEDGNMAIMFSIGLTLLLISTGVAVDYGNAVRHQSKLQGQVDSGVLAAAKVIVTNKGNQGNDPKKKREKKLRQEAAFKVLETNGFDMSGVNPIFEMNDESVILTAESEYIPYFGNFIGKKKINLVAESEATISELTNVEIVLVLDNTDSMNVNGKMIALKEGATNLIKTIERGNSETKIGLVPFSRYVRLNDSVKSKNWFQMPIEFDTPRSWEQATSTGGTCKDVTGTREVDGVTQTYQTVECWGQVTSIDWQHTTIESRWDGCVGSRLPPLNELDGSYVSKIPGLINTIPHENTILADDFHTYCPAEIVPMTDDYSSLINHVNNLWATDTTYLPSGLIWGQRVLSPGIPFDNKASDARQIMIVMTDGMNTAKVDTLASIHDFEGVPRIDNVQNPNDGSPEADAVTSRLCQKIKDTDIEVYTIAFQVNDSVTETLLRNCASDATKALKAENNQSLIDQFEDIANRLQKDVRLMR